MQPAPKTVLSEDEEKKLVQWPIELSHRGFGRTKDDVKDMVKTILDARGAKSVFKDNRPGKDWMQTFFKRHPEVAKGWGKHLAGREQWWQRNPWLNGSSKWNNTWTPWALLCSRLLAKFLILMKVASASAQRPPQKNNSRTGAKHVYSIRNSTQQQMTVLACSSAVGQYIPPQLPLLIFTYTRDPRFNALEGFEDALFPPPPLPPPPPQKKKNQWVDYWGGLSQLPERRLHSLLGRKTTSGAVCGWSFLSPLPGHHYFVSFRCCFDCC